MATKKTTVKKTAKKETRGRKPEYKDPLDFKKKVDEYFLICEEQDVFPDEAGMLIYCKLDRTKLRALTDEDNPKCEQFEDILAEAALKRESYLARQMAFDNKKAIGCMNLLKQRANGGYTDRPTEKKDNTLKVVVEGGGNDLFK